MKIIDKIVEYFYNRKIKVKIRARVKEINNKYYNTAIYNKLPFLKEYCIWSTYTNSVKDSYDAIGKTLKNNSIVKYNMSLESYIYRVWWNLKEHWLNIIDIIDDGDEIIKKSKNVFKKPVKKWYCGFGIDKRVFQPYNDDYINPVLYINKWTISWKPKYDYVCFENNPQMWICLFKFFWFGYKLVSPVKEDFEDSYWEQMIWYVNYCDCDLKKAEETWYGNWDKKYLKNE